MAFAAREIDQFRAHEKCIFCHENTADEFHFGKIYKYRNLSVHYFCLLFASHLQQNGHDKEGILGFLARDIQNELRNKANSICTYCAKRGAVTVCARKGCKVKFHFPCGVRNLSFHLFCDQYQSFCFAHRKFQTPRISFTVELMVSSICVICQSNIEPIPSLSNVWASCCKNSWFHKDCVQRLALSAGYFFKCPNCNNVKDFRNEMVQCGIYIPDQDAAWELEPNSFNDLTERYNSCDADECSCENGRNFSSLRGHWKIILCNVCGSQGVHNYCGRHILNKQEEWICAVCSPVVHTTCVVTKKLSQSTDAQTISNPRAVLPPSTPSVHTRRATRQKNIEKSASSDNLPISTFEISHRHGHYLLRNIPRKSLAEPKMRRTKSQPYPLLANNWKKKEQMEVESVQNSRRRKYTIAGTEVRTLSQYKNLLKDFDIVLPDVSFPPPR